MTTDGHLLGERLSEGFTFIDLFAGIGGFHKALALMGGVCTMAAEKDDDARDTYLENYDKPVYGMYEDIVDFTQSPALHALPRPDVLCAGFPCQPFSKSGAQQGLRDKTRGTLFFEIMEIVEEHHPPYLILENVKNLAGPRHIDTWNTIVERLRDEGYRVADHPIVASPHVLPVEAEGDAIPGGRPQVRERVFILAEYMGEDADPEDLVLPPQELALSLALSSYGSRRFWRLVPEDPDFDADAYWSIDDWLEDDTPQIQEAYGLTERQQQWIHAWQEFVDEVEWPRRQRADGTKGAPRTGFPVWADYLRADALEDIDEATPAWKASHITNNHALYMQNREFIDRWKPTVADFPPSRRKFEWQSKGERDLSKLVLQMRPSGIRVKRASYLPALVAITQTSIIGSRGRTLTPNETARLQGFDAPRGFHVNRNAAAAYKQMGNAVNVGVVAHMASALFTAGRRRGAAAGALSLR